MAFPAKKNRTRPPRTLYYTKSDEADYDNNYYDFSTGYTLSTTDNLSTAGEKTITVPGTVSERIDHNPRYGGQSDQPDRGDSILQNLP